MALEKIPTPANGSAELRQRTAASNNDGQPAAAAAAAAGNNKAVARALSAKEEDATHHEYEFGGPVGVLGMMTFFPCLFYYLYVCLFFYDGE